MLEYSAIIEQIKQAIERAARILVITHQNPDGDGLGALSALGQHLKSIGKNYDLFCVDPVPEQYQFLSLMHEVKNDPAVFGENFQAVIVVDAGDLHYAGVDQWLKRSADFTLINIDHHQTNDYFGELNLVLPEKSSASEIVYELLRFWQAPLDKETATALLNGLIFDTGAFSNSGTTFSTLKTAAHLLNLGARHREINTNILRNKSLGLLKLWGRAFERLEFIPDSDLALTVILSKDFEECGTAEEAASGLSNFFNELAGAKIAMVLIENSDGTVKGSLRTTHDGVDVSELAKKWGGGGHSKAAGFSLKGRMVYNENKWLIIDGQTVTEPASLVGGALFNH